jgi:hypothetical protein
MKRIRVALVALLAATACGDRSGADTVPAAGDLPINIADDTMAVQPDTQRVPPR